LEHAADKRLWIFASTIGELNAIEPFLSRYLAAALDPPLLLISDHEHYRDAFLSRYPTAVFLRLDGTSREALRAIKSFPPTGLLIAEMPCMLSDAPGRLSFNTVYAVKRCGVPICLVNGWLYGGAPASRMDRIEKYMFDRAYLRLFDLILVQNKDIRDELIAHGAARDSITVTGNIKFDAINHTGWSCEQAKDPLTLRRIEASGRPCIVGGCVTNLSDQEAILDAFCATVAAVPEALLILAPRHPEVTERMHQLRLFLCARKLAYIFRSELPDGPFERDIQVLVLDTIGELKDFYALATLAYVGPNHNVLEPLAFKKPVFVLPGWEKSYPSFPIYRLMLEHRAIIEVSRPERLAEAWIHLLRHPSRRLSLTDRIGSALARQKGATTRALLALSSIPAFQHERSDANGDRWGGNGSSSVPDQRAQRFPVGRSSISSS
jgi:3-deoxy-D-manno-octulosonic-acid transferase